jgi:hypothetical protein
MYVLLLEARIKSSDLWCERDNGFLEPGPVFVVETGIHLVQDVEPAIQDFGGLLELIAVQGDIQITVPDLAVVGADIGIENDQVIGVPLVVATFRARDHPAVVAQDGSDVDFVHFQISFATKEWSFLENAQLEMCGKWRRTWEAPTTSLTGRPFFVTYTTRGFSVMIR